MAVKFQDYYDVLGVSRSARPEEIQSAYRKLARKYHPDVNKSGDAEERFKRINEAYEVLGDPAKRQKYDQLGSNWNAGEEFTPPPGWDFSGGGQSRTTGSGGTFRTFDIFGDAGSGFSDFFESLFGSVGGFGGSRSDAAGAENGRRAQAPGSAPDFDHEAEITISLEDAYRGGRKTISVQQSDQHGRRAVRNLEITIPPGTADGKRLRLRGQGVARPDGAAGDLYLKIHIAPHAHFRVVASDIEAEVPVTPSEAVLGARVEVPLVDGRATVKIAPGTQSGRKLRLKGKGLVKEGKERGDLYVIVRIVVPTRPNEKEQELYRQLAEISSYNPRS
jgi:curved DNA-binding protein